MLVVRCRNPNSAERELIKAIKDLDGIAFIGYTVVQGEREREIDALVFTPVRAVAIEVKAPQLATPHEGELVPSTNGPWTIGGEKAQFYGGSNPMNQASTGAKIFATFLRERLEETPFVQVAVGVANTNEELFMKKGPQLLGQATVALIPQMVEGLELMKKRPITLDSILAIVEVMGLEALKPTRKELENEWASAEDMHKELAATNKTIARKREKELKKAQPKTPFFEFVEKLSHAFNTMTFVFLFIWFLYTLGVLDAIIHLFDALQVFVNHATGNTPDPSPVPSSAKELMNSTGKS